MGPTYVQPEDILTTSSAPERGLGGIAGFPLLGHALGPQAPRPAPWRLCFTFVAQQLLVSANILIMFDCVRSEAEVALCPLSMLSFVSKSRPPTWSVCHASPAARRSIATSVRRRSYQACPELCVVA